MASLSWMILIESNIINCKAPDNRKAGMSEKEMRQRSDSEKDLRMLCCWLGKWRKVLQAKACRWLLEAEKAREPIPSRMECSLG